MTIEEQLQLMAFSGGFAFNSPLPIDVEPDSWYQLLDMVTWSLALVTTGIPTQEGWGTPELDVGGTTQSQFEPELQLQGDMRFTLDPYDGFGDISLADRDVERDAGLETATLITIGSNQRADDEDPLPDNSDDRGGWWGDTIPVVPDDAVGCKLWLLRRAKTEPEVLSSAREYLRDGFQWMIDDGLASSVDITVVRARTPEPTLLMTIGIERPEADPLYYRFFYNWEAQILRRA